MTINIINLYIYIYINRYIIVIIPLIVDPTEKNGRVFEKEPHWPPQTQHWQSPPRCKEPPRYPCSCLRLVSSKSRRTSEAKELLNWTWMHEICRLKMFEEEQDATHYRHYMLSARRTMKKLIIHCEINWIKGKSTGKVMYC